MGEDSNTIRCFDHSAIYSSSAEEKSKKKGFENEDTNGRIQAEALEKKHYSVFKQPDALAVWFRTGTICHYVVYHADYAVGDHDDVVYHLWIHSDVSVITVCGRLGGPVQP